MVKTSPALVEKRYRMTRLMALYMLRPSSTAETMEPKLSSRRTMSDASFATSVPMRPIETPRSAATRDGASLTPSPVIAIISPFFLYAVMMRSLCSGVMRANTLTVRIFSASCRSERVSISSPVSIVLPALNIPASVAIACAVTLWSPVIMTTRIPAAIARRIASGTSGRSASFMPRNPTNTRFTMSLLERVFAGMCFSASATTRRPFSEKRKNRCSNTSRSFSESGTLAPSWSIVWHSLRMTSGAPATDMTFFPFPWCNTA